MTERRRQDTIPLYNSERSSGVECVCLYIYVCQCVAKRKRRDELADGRAGLPRISRTRKIVARPISSKSSCYWHATPTLALCLLLPRVSSAYLSGRATPNPHLSRRRRASCRCSPVFLSLSLSFTLFYPCEREMGRFCGRRRRSSLLDVAGE